MGCSWGEQAEVVLQEGEGRAPASNQDWGCSAPSREGGGEGSLLVMVIALIIFFGLESHEMRQLPRC